MIQRDIDYHIHTNKHVPPKVVQQEAHHNAINDSHQHKLERKYEEDRFERQVVSLIFNPIRWNTKPQFYLSNMAVVNVLAMHKALIGSRTQTAF